MKSRIIEFIRKSVEGEYLETALECLVVLREACINEEEAKLFNNFLRIIKEKLILKKNF